MAAWGYEFYLPVLKVSLTSERSKRVRDTKVIQDLRLYKTAWRTNLFLWHFFNLKYLKAFTKSSKYSKYLLYCKITY